MGLSKADLLEIVFNSLVSAGWSFSPPATTSLPLELNIHREGQHKVVVIYIWNVTHGGGRVRAPDEYRIQVTAPSPLVISPSSQTLLLGYYAHPDGDLLVAWDANRHATYGTSPSLQVKQATLDAAVQQGLATYQKISTAETVVAMRPEMLTYYLSTQSDMHGKLVTTFLPTGTVKSPAETTRTPPLRPTTGSGSTYPSPIINLFVTEQESALEQTGFFTPNTLIDARQHVLASIVQRQGQPQFRHTLMQAYGGKCCVTNCDVEQALQAAHISPYSGPESNRATNGLLLRSDVHDLFDCGLLVINSEDMRTVLHPDIRNSSYEPLHDVRIRLPVKPANRPSKVLLSAHRSWAGF